MLVLADIVSVLFRVYEFLIFIRVLLTWINTDPYRPVIDHPVIRILHRITEPVLAPLRRVIPPVGGALDISPIVALFALEILRWIAVFILRSFA
jgi:YggT family protein